MPELIGAFFVTYKYALIKFTPTMSKYEFDYSRLSSLFDFLFGLNPACQFYLFYRFNSKFRDTFIKKFKENIRRNVSIKFKDIWLVMCPS